MLRIESRCTEKPCSCIRFLLLSAVQFVYKNLLLNRIWKSCNYINFTVLLRNNRTQNVFETRSTRIPAAVGAQAGRPLHKVRPRSGCVPAPVEPCSCQPSDFWINTFNTRCSSIMGKLSTYARNRIVSLKSSGMSVVKITEALKEEGIETSRSAVNLFLLRYQRTDCIADAKRSGSSPILNEEQLKFIDEKMKANDELTLLDLKIRQT